MYPQSRLWRDEGQQLWKFFLKIIFSKKVDKIFINCADDMISLKVI